MNLGILLTYIFSVSLKNDVKFLNFNALYVNVFTYFSLGNSHISKLGSKLT